MGTKLLLLSLLLPILLLLLLFLLFRYFIRIRIHTRRPSNLESGPDSAPQPDPHREDLLTFPGGDHLTVQDILDAPGEVVGKSGYGTSYRAGFGKTGSVMLLRFVRPACVAWAEGELREAVRALGAVRHQNLVPMAAMYVGPRGEKLFVHPYYGAGNLMHFLKDGKAESHRWEIIYKLTLGIARGLDHLHNGLQKPVVHGNLKSRNVLIDADYQPRLSDFGLHLLLNPTAAQEMLESNAAQGYKAPELIKMKDASRESDIYCLGVIFFEILTRKEPTNLHLPASLRNLFLENKISEPADDNDRRRSSTIEEGLLKFFQLAMACCSPNPVLRPNIRHVIRKIEEIGQ
ncbi:putative kinase-like protein TMKL1 [Iris pallida]|uniref:Kinase-like protein TMKL1 n=1 Tax=Iris pallida TaxID=29817 RepID=A0AAX6IF50_IRIPA|nr:putative kinase-like protein TMKL1 [Iris pallida]